LNGRDRAPFRRILVIRTSALGDIVQALPVLTELRRRFPEARIGWVVDESFAPLLAGHEMIDELLSVPLRRWRRSGPGNNRLYELIAFLRRLRRFEAQLAVDLMGNHKGALVARASGAPVRLGARRRDRREPASALWINRPVEAVGEHAVDRMYSLLAALGPGNAAPDFAGRAIACGRDQIPRARYVYLHPGAAWGNKRYPPELWGEAAAEIALWSGLEVWVGAGPGEQQLAHAVISASSGAARTCQAETLDELAGVIRGARLVLAADTGAVHLARALEVAVVAVHGPTDPARHGPYGVSDAVAVRSLPCSFCHRRMGDAKACLLGIDPRQIARLAQAQLEAAAV